MSAFELEDFFDVVRLPDERFATIKLPLINFDLTRSETKEKDASLLRADQVHPAALPPIDNSLPEDPGYVLEDIDAYTFSEDLIVTGLEEKEHGLWDLTTDLFTANLNADIFSWDIIGQQALESTHFHVAEPPLAAPRRLAADGSHDHGLEVTAYLRALQDLSQGRSSSYFSYDISSKSFAATTKSVSRAVQASPSSIQTLVELGNCSKVLHDFCYRDGASSAPSLHALQLAIRDALDVVAACVIPATAPDTITISEPRGKPLELIHMLKVVVEELEKTESWSARHVVEIISNARTVTNPVIQALLAIACQSWLEQCSRSIGLGAADVEMAELSMPDILDHDSTNMITESSELLHSILHDQPEHPLSAPSGFGITIPSLELAFRESDIAGLEHKAEQYRHDIMHAIEQYQNQEGTTQFPHGSQFRSSHKARSHPLHRDNRDTTQQLQSSIAQFSDLPYLQRSNLYQNLHDACADYLTTKPGDHQPSTRPSFPSLVTASIKPLLTAQHSLLTHATLAATLHRHALLKHLQIHHLFALLSSGTLATYLKCSLLSPLRSHPARQLDPTHALCAARSVHFPSERSSAAPALALSTTHYASSSPATTLRLSLPTPPALAQIFTPASTAVYAAAFTRLTTLLHARAALEALHLPCTRTPAGTWPRSRGRLAPPERLTLRFRVEAARALDTLTLRFTDGVTSNWRRLTHELADAQASLQGASSPGRAAGAVASVAGLAAAHATFLARVAGLLLLPREGCAETEARAGVALEGLLSCVVVGAGRIAQWVRGRGVRASSQARTSGAGEEEEEKEWMRDVRELCEGLVRTREALRVACAGFGGGKALARALSLEPGRDEDREEGVAGDSSDEQGDDAEVHGGDAEH